MRRSPCKPIRISQVYGGGDAGGPYPCDFIELFNANPQTVSLAGWSVQFRLATSGFWSVKPLGDLSIAGNGYFLLHGTCSETVPPPPHDLEWSRLIDHTKGRVAIASKATGITGLSDSSVVDFVGYGAASEYEGSDAAPALTGTWQRCVVDGGCTDTDNNSADFTALTPAPRNSSSPPHPCTDPPPAVETIVPGDGATAVPPDANITVTFSEPVSLAPDWFEVTCALSAPVDHTTAAVTPASQSFTIDPDANFFADDNCTVTIKAGGVTDNDTADPPDYMAGNYTATFHTAPGQCGDQAHAIHDVQGAGSASPVAGQRRVVEGVVTGDFQGAAALSGFFLQEADAEADPLTSEGIFVDEYAGSLADVAAGDRVRVAGTVGEVDGMTVLAAPTRMLSCGAGALPAAVDLTLPLGSTAEWERYEGMLVRLTDSLTVADSAELGSQGRLTLVLGPVPQYYTHGHPPDAAGYAAWENDLALRTVVLDDGSERAYPDPIPYPAASLSAVHNAPYGRRGCSPADRHRRPPRRACHNPAGHFARLCRQNSRSPAPARASGAVRVVFLSLDDYFNVTTGLGGPRGASSPEEFVRQRDKLIRALLDLDATVIAVSKLQNNGFGPSGAIANLLAGLNMANGSTAFAYVDPGLPGWGSDAVSVGILYRVSSVRPIGLPAGLDAGAFGQAGRRPQSPHADGPDLRRNHPSHERFTVVVNEWRGRTACPASGPDADAGDGQGCWNAARTAAGAGTGGLARAGPDQQRRSRYARARRVERPAPGGSASAPGRPRLHGPVGRDLGPDAVTTLDGARGGYTDHALASPSLAPQVLATAAWAINAAEPAALDYQMEHKTSAQLDALYAPDPYRSSDRDPIVVDLKLATNPLAVDLVSLASHAEGQRVVLTWETASEQDLAGFDLHRARSAEGPWQLVNAARIPAAMPGAPLGASYRYEDEPGEAGTWLHRLTAVDMSGERRALGTVETTLEFPTALRLAAFRATRACRRCTSAWRPPPSPCSPASYGGAETVRYKTKTPISTRSGSLCFTNQLTAGRSQSEWPSPCRSAWAAGPGLARPATGASPHATCLRGPGCSSGRPAWPDTAPRPSAFRSRPAGGASRPGRRGSGAFPSGTGAGSPWPE